MSTPNPHVVNGRWTARKGQGHFVPRSELSASQQTLLAAVPRWKRAWVRPASLKPNQSPNFKVLKWILDTGAQKEEGSAEEMEAALKVVVSGAAEGLTLDGEVGGETPMQTASGFASGTATPALRERENTSEGESSTVDLDILPGAITPSLMGTSAGPSKLATETFTSEVNTPQLDDDEHDHHDEHDEHDDHAHQEDSDAILEPEHQLVDMDSGPSSALANSPLVPNLTLPPDMTLSLPPVGVGEAVEELKGVPVDAIDIEMGDGEKEPFIEDEVQLAQEATAGMIHEA